MNTTEITDPLEIRRLYGHADRLVRPHEARTDLAPVFHRLITTNGGRTGETPSEGEK